LTRSDRWLKFIQKLKIRARNRKIIPLEFNHPQRRVWDEVAPKIDRLEPIRLIILKARREGISTEIESWLMTMIASGDNVNALVTAHQKKPAGKIWSMSKLFVTSSPILSSLATVGANKIEIGRSILEVATAGSPESERGGDLTAWHASEAAFYPHPEVMTATMQSLPDSKDIFTIGVLESTANGKVGDGALFYQEWTRAIEGDSEWVPIFLPYHEFPEYSLPGIAVENLDAEEFELRKRFELTDAQLAWRRWKIANDLQGDIDKFHQEYPAFPEGTRGSIDPDGTFHATPKGPVEIFVWPQDGHEYVVGGDSSMGIEDKDETGPGSHSRSAAEVIDMETMEQVAEYDGVSPPHLFARHLAGLGRLYKNALLAPEVQSSGGGGGRELIVYLRDLEYWNLHKWKQPDRVERTVGTLYGWETNARTRPRMLARIREVVMERSAVIHSRRLLTQLSSFGEADSGRMESLAGHDDLLFAWGIALVSRTENYYVMPHQSAPVAMPDWQSLGLRVLHPESAPDRLRRLLSAADVPNRSFLEL
jgi:hypothetical protein